MDCGCRNPEGYYEGDVPKRKIHCFEPLGYLDFLNLMAYAKIVLTDSGGIHPVTAGRCAEKGKKLIGNHEGIWDILGKRT